MAHVITNIERPPADMVTKFSKLAVATVYEASGRKGFVASAIKPNQRGNKLCGPAFTVECHPKDNLMLHKALEKATPGDIIVATTGGYYEAGYWGDLMTTSAIARKIGGLAIDACVRDSEELGATGWPVFCRGFCIAGTVKNTLGTVNHPIIFGGALVHPGDLILGDDDGMVIVARERIDEVYAKSVQRVEAEVVKAETLKGGISSVAFNKLDKKFEALGLIEE